MKVSQHGNRLTVQATTAAKETLLYLGVGTVFALVGLGMVVEGGTMVGLLFLFGGAFALFSFYKETAEVQRTYVFDRAARELYTNGGVAIPFAQLQIRFHEDTWRGSYNSIQRAHGVLISAGTAGQFRLPANSAEEARAVTDRLNAWISSQPE